MSANQAMSETPEIIFNYDLKKYIDVEQVENIDYLKDEKHLKVYKKDDYKVLKYNKDKLGHTNVDTLGLFRSVILKNNVPVCFAPPKSYSITHEMESNFNSEPNSYAVEEFVEGTMINLFFDGAEWECATRSLIGARGKFFKSYPTFRTMFLETMNHHNLDFSDLDKDYCYSFVLSHPKNIIVCKVAEPRLTLVGIYKCGDDFVVSEVNKYHSQFAILQSKIPYVNVGFYPQIEQVKETFGKKDVTPYTIMGAVIRNMKDGKRYKIRNPNYEYVKELRGNQPKTQFQYLSLRKNGRVHEFLQFYPEYKEEFSRYRDQVHKFTNDLLTNYIRCYVKKEKPLGQFPKQFRQHMYILHQSYVNNLLPNKEYINKGKVVEYINNMLPEYLMYGINFEHRKQKMDEEVKEKETIIQEKIMEESS